MPPAKKPAPRARRAAPASKAEREAQRRQEIRRGRVILGGAVVSCAIMLAAWFPFSTLFTQRQHLNSAQAQLSSLKAQDATLKTQEKTLTSSGDVMRLAREQYQLVQPGQRLVQVLPPSGTPTQGDAGQAPYPGDPGLTKPVAPSAIALLPTTTTTRPVHASATSTTAKSQSGSGAAPGLVHRILSTLTFWRR